jgi:hypothetical protein
LSTDEFSGTEMTKVTCGTGICEAVLHHNDQKALSAFWMHRSSGKMPWDTETFSFYEHGENGSFTTRLFFSKAPGDLSFHIRAREAMLRRVEEQQAAD